MPRRLPGLAFAGLLCLLASAPSQAAGLQRIEIPADAAGPALSGLVWTPCAAPPGEVRIDPVTIPGTWDCPVAGEHLPLVVISHGVGGWFAGHHDTAAALANAGFVVAAINHPGDSSKSPDRHTGDLSALTERPTDIKRLVDFMLSAWAASAHAAPATIDPARIGTFGFSRGGFTGLVVIGGNPDFRTLLAHCPDYPGNRMCAQIRAGEAPSGPLTHDPRIRAAVLADPVFAPLFVPDGLTGITIPVQLWSSEHGGDGMLPEEVAAVEHTLSLPPEFHAVPGAAHFAFLAPCGPAMTQAAPEICVDGPGFDRVAFHARMNEAVVAFFRAHLPAVE
jgi:predicted dienelactone hydrolase